MGGGGGWYLLEVAKGVEEPTLIFEISDACTLCIREGEGGGDEMIAKRDEEGERFQQNEIEIVSYRYETRKMVEEFFGL